MGTAVDPGGIAQVVEVHCPGEVGRRYVFGEDLLEGVLFQGILCYGEVYGLGVIRGDIAVFITLGEYELFQVVLGRAQYLLFL